MEISCVHACVLRMQSSRLDQIEGLDSYESAMILYIVKMFVFRLTRILLTLRVSSLTCLLSPTIMNLICLFLSMWPEALMTLPQKPF
jgi:hypothetical protein